MKDSIQIALLDDYQNAALSFADWNPVTELASVSVYNDHQTLESDIAARLRPFHVLCVMRERTPLPESLLAQLPNLRLIVSTGPANSSIDTAAAQKLGITVRHTGYVASGAPELTWALLLAAARRIPQEYEKVRTGGWQSTIGKDLSGQTLGIIGLGNIGQKVAAYAKAFDMNVIAWSENLTDEKAGAAGALKVSRSELFERSDFITIHLPLSERSRNLIGRNELESMKSSAILVNTSRGPIVNEQALITALETRLIAGAALDVFDREPLDSWHPFRNMDNVIASPHIGYVTENTYRVFYGDTVKIILEAIQTGLLTSI